MNPSGRMDEGRSDGRNTRRMHAVDWALESGAGDDVLIEMERSLARRRSKLAVGGGLVAAALAVLAVIGGGARPDAVKPGGVAPSTIVLAVPERRVLNDGSTVELRTGTHLEVVFEQTMRKVIFTGGEAHFKVAKDVSRPFVVVVDRVVVRAIGTEFSVRMAGGEVGLLVTEGRVAVESAAPGGERLTELDAGGSFEVGAANDVSSAAVTRGVSSEEMGRRLAWRVPTVEFSGTSLPDAVEAMNRHANVRITVADPSLSSVRVSGVLRGDNVGALLRLLEEEHGVGIERMSDGELRLTPAR